MSCQKGNAKKSGPPKHANRTAFKNSLHDTSKTTKVLNSLVVGGVCRRCKDIIEWKIKFKKYKIQGQAGKCVKCDQRTVKKSYCIVCESCATSLSICQKCAKKSDDLCSGDDDGQPDAIVAATEPEAATDITNELGTLQITDDTVSINSKADVKADRPKSPENSTSLKGSDSDGGSDTDDEDDD